MKLIRLLLPLCLAMVSACSATGPKYSQMADHIPALAEGQTRLFFYRESGFLGSARFPDIHLNNRAIGAIYNHGFFYHDTPPGQHEISIELWDMPGKESLYLGCEADTTYFIEVGVRGDMLLNNALQGAIAMNTNTIPQYQSHPHGMFTLSLIEPDWALRKLYSLSFIDNSAEQYSNPDYQPTVFVPSE